MSEKAGKSRFRKICLYSILWLAILLSCLTVQTALLEGVLRWWGYGESTHFLVKREVNGITCHTPNRAFYQQFTALPLDRIMTWDDLDFQVPAVKAPNAYRIFVFGGSAIYGTRSSARILEMMLREALPSVKWEVYNAACPGMNSHVMLQAARACASLEPDLFLIYMGNNEAVGPFGPATKLGQSRLLWRTPVIRLLIAANDLRIVQLFRRTGAVTALNLPDKDALMKMLPGMTDNPRTLALFERNVADMCKAAASVGCKVQLCTLSGNKRFMGVVATQHSEDTGASINGVLRKLATAQPNAHLLDVAGMIAAHSKDGLPGYDFFVDNVHFNFDGNYLAASAMFQTLEDSQAPLSKEGCAERLAWTPAAEYDLLGWQMQAFLDDYSRARVQRRRDELAASIGENGQEQLFNDFVAALKFHPDDLYLRQSCFRQVVSLKNVTAALEQSSELIKHHPAARSSLRSAGIAAEMGSQPDAAIAAYKKCLGVYPDDPEALRRLAEMLFAKGELAAAEPLYRRYLRIDGTDAFAWCRIGEIQAAAGKENQAAKTWKAVIAQAPTHPLAYRLLDALMEKNSAAAQRVMLWDAMIKEHPEAAEPLVRRALIYETAGDGKAALELLQRAMALAPGDPVVQYHFGIVAYEQDRMEEAAAAFKEAMRLNPSDERNARWLEKVLQEQSNNMP